MLKTRQTLTVVLILCIGPRLLAQSTLGSVVGTIRDDSGSVLIGAKVTTRNMNTGFTREAMTDDSGEYESPLLPAGVYEVRVEASGFKRFVRVGVVVEATVKFRVDASLQVGDLQQSVTVNDAPPVLQTETPRIGTLLTSKVAEDTPVIGRSGHFTYISMMPGGLLTTQFRYSINGSRGWDNGITLDGVSTTRPLTGDNMSAVLTDRDAIQEVRYDSVNNSAEFEHATTISTFTKAGTNEYHGSGEFTRQNGAWAARNFFSSSPPVLRVQNTALTIGGPLWIPKIYNGKNRSFFFFSFWDSRSPMTTASRVNVPTVAMRKGDFSQITAAIKDPLTGQPFPNKQIPVDRFSGPAQKLQTRFYDQMLPNFGGPSNLAGNFSYDWPRDTLSKPITGRLDHRINDKNSLFGTVTQANFAFIQPVNSLPLTVIGPLTRLRDDLTISLSDTHIFAPRIVNEFRAGLLRTNWPRTGPLKGQDIINLAGLTGYSGTLPDSLGFPTVSITGFQSLSQDDLARDVVTSVDIHDHVIYRVNRHAIKFGVNVQRNFSSAYPSSPSRVFGAFTFDGSFSGQPYADFLLGLPRTASRSALVPPRYDRNTNVHLFAQDDWNVTPNLTVNLGLRYDQFRPYTEQYDRLASFDIATGKLVVTNQRGISQISSLFPSSIPIVTAQQAGYPERTLLNLQGMNFAPRLGVVYRLGSKMVIRSGYGIFYTNQLNKAYVSLTTGPFTATETFDNIITNSVPLFAWPRAFPSGSGPRPLGIQDVTGANPNLRNSYAQQWNFSIERDFLDTAIRISYIGSAAVQLPFVRNANQPLPSLQPFNQNLRPFPFVRNITYIDSGGTQSYEAFQVEANRRFRDGLSFNAHYTWSSNITDSPDDSQSGGTIENAYDRRRDRGQESYNPRHRFILNMLYEFPVGRGKVFGRNLNRGIDFLIGGWSLSAIAQVQSGTYFTPTFSGVDTSGTNVTSGRPDRIADGNLPASQRTLSRWFDPSAFAVPQKGRFGNSGRAILEGPGAELVSFGLFKHFRPFERLTIRLEGRATNSFNHPYFANPAANISVPGSVGVITATNPFAGVGADVGSRSIELGLRLVF